jgi:Lrp/AsnC family transcriptional regulator
MQTHLDKTDIHILELLQRDAALSAAEIAERVGLSQSPCWRRINRLEEGGLIRKRVALLDGERLGLDLVVFIMVSLTAHGRQSLAEFEEAIRQLPEVTECYTITGTMDYMLKIVARDIHHFEQFIRGKLAQLEGVREMHSFVAVTEIKCTAELPLELRSP